MLLVHLVPALIAATDATTATATLAASTTTAEARSSEPFAWGDFTWLQGNNRQKASLLDTKYFTGTIIIDVNYNLSNHLPIDHTNVGSTATFREGEVNLSFAAFGGDFHYENARGRLLLQLGTRATGVPRNDATPLRGQFDLYDALRYISEAYGGYHWNALHGINLDVGMFMSYVGLLSYNNFENWNYQPSYTSDNTPWFFTGARIQIFPSDKLKIEPWLINGWQTYGMFNEMPGIGLQILYRPTTEDSMLLNAYVGFDTPGTPGRVRFHSDNSWLHRWYVNPDPDGFITQAAFSLTADLGFENGAGVVPFGGGTAASGCVDASGTPHGCDQNFVSGMIYHRVWFDHNLFGWTVGGGFMHNPGRYLVLAPTGLAAPGAGPNAFTMNPGDPFDAWDASTTLQYMPIDYLTFGLEVVYRHASVPYFAGHGGVTSPNGYGTYTAPNGSVMSNAPANFDPNSFKPDLRNDETRLILSMLFRM
jgi:opacity protein-like surface antigen